MWPAVPSLGLSFVVCVHSRPQVSSAPPAAHGVRSTRHPANTHGKGQRQGQTHYSILKTVRGFGDFTIFCSG